MSYSRYERIRALAPIIRNMNKKKLTIPEASKQLGWSVSVLRLWLRIEKIKWNKTRKRNGYTIPKDGWDEKIKTMLAQGKTQNYIADALGCGNWNVTRYIKKHNILQPTKHEPNKSICNQATP